MGERVQTGGVMSFDYPNSTNLKLNDFERLEIKKGYEEYIKRKKRERKNKIIIWILILLGAFTAIYFLIR